MAGSPSSSELDQRRRMIRYRAWHRGMREMDLIFGPFSDSRIAAMDDETLDRFEALLDESDQDLYRWIVGSTEPPERIRSALLDDVIEFREGLSASYTRP